MGDHRQENPFEEIKNGVETLVRDVLILPMETEDGGKEWRFAPRETDEMEMTRLLGLWDGWEKEAREDLLRVLPNRTQEIVEILRIVRSKISLNRTNRHFMGYLREGAEPTAGREFYVTTFVRTLDHLRGIWESVCLKENASPDAPPVPEGQ